MNDKLYLSITADEQLKHLRRLKDRIPEIEFMNKLKNSSFIFDHKVLHNCRKYQKILEHKLKISKPSVRLMFDLGDL